METITSGLCHIKNLIFLENLTVWFRNSLDVQSTNSSVELYNILSYSWFFFNSFFNFLFCTSSWKKVHNSKEIVNLQGLFVLTVGYKDIKTDIHLQSITILLKRYIFFIGCLYYLSLHFHSCCFYIQSPGGIRMITSMPV